MALTLYEASKINDGDVVRSAVIQMFADNSEILAAMPFEDIPGGSLSYNQEGTLPGVAFRGFNEAYSEDTGILNPQVEVLRIAGGDLDVDKAIIKTRGEATRSTHEAMKVKAMALYLTGKLINGDSTSDPREFDGLRNRITGSQLIANGSTSGGDPLSLDKLDETIDAVDNPTHIIMSKAMRRRMAAAARNPSVAGDIRWELNEFGRRVAFYNDLPILVADYDDAGSRIIDFNEASNNVTPGSSATSVYVVSFGEGMVTGLQNGVMEVEDLGEIDSKPVYRTRVEWLVGMAVMHGRACARLWSISDAAVVA
jgi:hypothetical protein